jgi:hypothetical protein
MDATRNKRTDDVGVKLPGGIEIRARGKDVIFVIIAIGALGLLYWHDYKSDNWARSFHEGQWAQTLILATPEKERPDALRRIAKDATVPANVQIKINESHR